MEPFQDKIAIVTGGASGIGRELCRQLAARGAAAVVVADRNLAGARETAERIVAAGGRARAVQVDVTQAEAVEQLVTDTVAEYGRLDYLFNNAGIALVGDLRDTTLAHWQQIVDVNLWGIIHGSSSAYQVMARQGFGHIVNTSSMTGLAPAAVSTAYAATKHAVVGLSTSLRAEAANLGVKVSVACPAIVRTPILETTVKVSALKEGSAYPDLAAYGSIAPDRCARIILRGVARNRAIIPAGAAARLVWLLYRLAPSFVIWIYTKGSAAFQAVREEPSPP
jgi:NAD(P)-dependent dehydrogenase (short-subunit alcohol dehydrogenase family)